jgi:hypothetical protein
VAAGLSPLDIGSDLGGSVLNPAHYCGIFGMRPTERRVSLAGLSGDPLPDSVRSVGDLRLAMQVIAGPDGSDSEVPAVPWRAVPPVALRELRIRARQSLRYLHRLLDEPWPQARSDGRRRAPHSPRAGPRPYPGRRTPSCAHQAQLAAGRGRSASATGRPPHGEVQAYHSSRLSATSLQGCVGHPADQMFRRPSPHGDAS